MTEDRQMTTSNSVLARGLAAAVVLIAGMSAARAAEVWLVAKPFTPASGALAGIPMWGYADCGASFAGCAAAVASSPGPVINVPAGEGLIVHLSNALADPTSIQLVGARTAPLPPAAPRVNGRLQSLTVEVAAGGTGDYSWSATDLRPGTYLYQSASHVQLQVQMGLYGAVVHNAPDASCGTPPCAYPGVAYGAAQLFVFSEVDPALHSPPAPVNATVDGYRPRILLINGTGVTTPVLPAITATGGVPTLLRLVNAGLTNHAPQLLGGDFSVVAEDSYPLAVSHRQSSALLPAAKTLDAVFTPDATGAYNMLDRMARVGLSAAPPPPPPTQNPVAANDVFYITANNINLPANPANYSITFASPGVLANDSDPQNDALRVAPGSVGALQGVSGALLSVDTSTGATRGRVQYRAPAATWVGDAYFTYVAREATTVAQLDSATAAGHVVHDQHLTRTQFHNPTGTVNDRWDLIGEVRALPAAATVTVSFVQNTNNTACTRVGEVIATVSIAASATPTAWSYGGAMANPAGCNRIRIEVAVPAANGVPAHAATLDVNFQRVNP
ncbi:MAG: multicopper oxidase domain-containing protein [Steroidobacteraceae bacterium]